MTAAEWVAAIVIFLIALGMAIISIRSFQNKGFLFNNAFIYASKTERETMDKKPYYRQSAIVFLFLCFVFCVIRQPRIESIEKRQIAFSITISVNA